MWTVQDFVISLILILMLLSLNKFDVKSVRL